MMRLMNRVLLPAPEEHVTLMANSMDLDIMGVGGHQQSSWLVAPLPGFWVMMEVADQVGEDLRKMVFLCVV